LARASIQRGSTPGTSAPAGLAALCERLLARDPSDRPDGVEILSALGQGLAPATVALAEARVPGPFVDRIGELAALQKA